MPCRDVIGLLNHHCSRRGCKNPRRAFRLLTRVICIVQLPGALGDFMALAESFEQEWLVTAADEEASEWAGDGVPSLFKYQFSQCLACSC